jgi:hypothetical protein
MRTQAGGGPGLRRSLYLVPNLALAYTVQHPLRDDEPINPPSAVLDARVSADQTPSARLTEPPDAGNSRSNWPP